MPIWGSLICIHPHLGGFFHKMATASLKNIWLNLCTLIVFSPYLGMYVCYVCVHVFMCANEGTHVLCGGQSPWLPSCLGQPLIVVSGYTSLDSLGTSRDSPVSGSHLDIGVLILQIYTTASGFMSALEIWTQAIMLLPFPLLLTAFLTCWTHR